MSFLPLGLAFCGGLVAGMRVTVLPALIAWFLLMMLPAGTANSVSPWQLWTAAGLMTALMLGEFVYDALSKAVGRLRPISFTARLAVGGLFGAATGFVTAGWLPSAIAGLAGAAIGTVASTAIRRRLAGSLGRDWPGAVIGDAVAVIGALTLGAVFL